jgi:hypothetical protein
MRSFNAVFIPWWNHAHSNNVRSARLDAAQFNHMHTKSPAHAMAQHMRDDDMLRVQRVALKQNNAHALSLYEVACMLGLSEDVKGALRPADGLEDAITRLLSLPAREAAALIHFARIASLKDRMLSYGLGAEAVASQRRALKRRFEVRDDEDDGSDETNGFARFPDHATHLYWCSACNAVSNARVELNSKCIGHTEVGVAQTMLYVGGIGEPSSIRCAKRASAALRTAIQKESHAFCSRVEYIDVNDASMGTALSDNSEAMHSARLRRDIKTCAVQGPTTVACGDAPMIKINIVGKVARVCGKWYAICFTCGSIFVVAQHKRYLSGLCCGRCDVRMLAGHGDAAERSLNGAARTTTSTVCRNSEGPTPNQPPTECTFSAHMPANQLPCRYCGRPQTESARFKVVRAPLDDGGRNAHIPPPLRIAAYCSSHYRSWMEWASLKMNTRVIFAHISTKAIPTFGADVGRRDPDRVERRVMCTTQSSTSNKLFRQLSKRMRQNNKGPSDR